MAAPRLALAGNPNTGKSTLFSALTGQTARVANYPGTTVELALGRWGPYEVVDCPGLYSLEPFADEERAAVAAITESDAAVNVVDATRLERDLFLTLQLTDLGMPMVVALNMMDEARSAGIRVDVARLATLLAVPVIPTVATRGSGLAALRRALRRLPPSSGVRNRGRLATNQPAEGGRSDLPAAYEAHRRRAAAIAAAVVSRRSSKRKWSAVLGVWTAAPFPGLLLAALVLGAIYLFLAVGVAGWAVDFTEGVLLQSWYVPFVQRLVMTAFPPGSPVFLLLAGDYGVLTLPPVYLVGLILPILVAFHLCLGILEDTGYLPRLAALLDRFFHLIGLNGRAVIPFVLGMGCVTMATLATRTLASRRERRIATILLALAVPCSAQMAVVAGLLARHGPSYLALYAAAMLAVLVATGAALDRLWPGRQEPLFLELPPLRLPSWPLLLRKTIAQAAAFLSEAAPLFFLGALGIAALQASGTLPYLLAVLAPLTTGWLGLPPAAAPALLMGFLRRDFGAAGFSTLSLTAHQSLVAAVTITLFVPCLASLAVIVREQGWPLALAIWAMTFTAAILVGGCIAALGA